MTFLKFYKKSFQNKNIQVILYIYKFLIFEMIRYLKLYKSNKHFKPQKRRRIWLFVKILITCVADELKSYDFSVSSYDIWYKTKI
jgi:hypothetical protein